MVPKTTNATVKYDPVVISEEISLHFTKVTDANGDKLYGSVMKNSAKCGSISYESRGDYLVISVKPFSSLTHDEVIAVCTQAPLCIKDALT